MTTGKTIALTIRTFVGKVMSLLFNMLSGLVIAFLPRSKQMRGVESDIEGALWMVTTAMKLKTLAPLKRKLRQTFLGSALKAETSFCQQRSA